jgi:3-oxoacyl-[acyl-carrier protein] reductase
LVAEGAACIVNYPAPHKREEAVALVDELRKLGVSTDAMVADVTHSCAVQNLIIAVREKFGRLDIPVNNAGVNSLQTWEENRNRDMGAHPRRQSLSRL